MEDEYFSSNYVVPWLFDKNFNTLYFVYEYVCVCVCMCVCVCVSSSSSYVCHEVRPLVDPFRSGHTYLEVSSEVCHDSFCQFGNSVSLSWVVCHEAFCLHVVSSSSCMCVCMYVSIYVYVCIYVCMNAFMYYVSMHICIYVYVYIYNMVR